MGRHAPHVTHHLAELRNAARLGDAGRAAAARKGLAAAGFDEVDELDADELEPDEVEEEGPAAPDVARSVAPVGRSSSRDRMSVTAAAPPTERG